MSRSDARPFLGPPDEDGPEPPVHGPGPVARALSALLRLFMGNMRLRSDARRDGQDAFTASAFTRLAVTQMLSLGGDAMVTVALAGSLFFSTSVATARGRVTLSLLLTVAPFALVAPLLGPMVDRVKGGRRAMIVASAVGRIVACLFMARYINGLLLFPSALLALVCSKTYTVAKAAIVPAVVEHNDDLVEANSKLAIGGAIAGFFASVPGVPILKLFGAATLLQVDSVVFLLCAFSAFRLVPAATARVVRLPEPDKGPASRFKARANLPPGGLTAAAVAMATLRFTVGFMVFLVAFAFRRAPAAPAWWYGVILAASVGGNLVGAAIAPRLRGRVREEYIVAGSLAAVMITAIVLFPFDVFQRRPAASVLAAVVGIAAGAAKLAFDSLVQQEVPAAAQGRMFGRLEATFQLVWVLGALVPVVIALTLGQGDVVVALVAGAALVTYLVSVRLARQGHLPHWWPGTGHRPASGPAIAGGVGAPTVAGGGGSAVPFWPEPPSPTGGGVPISGPDAGFGGPGAGRGGPTGTWPGLADTAVGGPGVGLTGGSMVPTVPGDGPVAPPAGADSPTVASGPPTTPNLARPPRLRPPPLGGGAVPEDPS